MNLCAQKQVRDGKTNTVQTIIARNIEKILLILYKQTTVVQKWRKTRLIPYKCTKNVIVIGRKEVCMQSLHLL